MPTVFDDGSAPDLDSSHRARARSVEHGVVNPFGRDADQRRVIGIEDDGVAVVIQADGGTRTASISGAYVALALAMSRMQREIPKNPLHGQVAAVSVGIFRGTPVLDLDYDEDSEAETDMNVVMNEAGRFVEIQGTAEGHAFSDDELTEMLRLARSGIDSIITAQDEAIGSAKG